MRALRTQLRRVRRAWKRAWAAFARRRTAQRPSAITELERLEPLRMGDVVGRFVEGHSLSLGVLELPPNVAIEDHTHPEEQLGILIRGTLRLRVGDETRVASAGTTWTIPAGTPHATVVGPEGAIILECFTPARTEWGGVERLEPTAPAWPERRDDSA